jgi:molybdopterin molybdotransferase
MLLAKIPHRGKSIPLLGLPGNPQSAIVGLMSLGAPLIDALLGRKTNELQTVITENELVAPKDFTRLVLGNLVQGRFEMGEHLGSAMLRGLAASTGFAVASSGTTPVGGQVRWLPLPQ